MVQVISELKENTLNIKDENAKKLKTLVIQKKKFSKSSIKDSLSDREEAFTESTDKKFKQINVKNVSLSVN